MAFDLSVRKVARFSASLRAGTAYAAVGVFAMASLPALAQRTPTRPRAGTASSSQPLSGEFKPSQPLAGRNSGFAQTNFARFPVVRTPLPNVPVTNIGTR